MRESALQAYLDRFPHLPPNAPIPTQVVAVLWGCHEKSVRNDTEVQASKIFISTGRYGVPKHVVERRMSEGLPRPRRGRGSRRR